MEGEYILHFIYKGHFVVICALFVARTASANENGQNDRKSNCHWLKTNLILGITVSFRTENHETNEADSGVNSWAIKNS